MKMSVTKYEIHLLDLWHSDNDNAFYLIVQYNPLQVGMHDLSSAISHLFFKITADSIQILVFPFD